MRTLRDDGTLADTSKRWFWGFDLTKAPPQDVLVEGGAQEAEWAERTALVSSWRRIGRVGLVARLFSDLEG